MALELTGENGKKFHLKLIEWKPWESGILEKMLIKASKAEDNALNVSLCKQVGLNKVLK